MKLRDLCIYLLGQLVGEVGSVAKLYSFQWWAIFLGGYVIASFVAEYWKVKPDEPDIAEEQ